MLILFSLISGCGKKNSTTGPTAVEPTNTDIIASTMTSTQTLLPTMTITQSSTVGASNTYTKTTTETMTLSPTITSTPTVSQTFTFGSSETNTPTIGESYTDTLTITMTLTRTISETETVLMSSTMTPTITFTVTPASTAYHGSASITSSLHVAGTFGNTVEITYTNGDITWDGPEPVYGTIEIVIPSGWSSPSNNILDPGYFSITLPTGGTLEGRAVSGHILKVKVTYLPAATGQVVITYGDKSEGGPGAYIDSTGSFDLNTSVDESGEDSFVPLDADPVVVVILPTSTITPTNTPIVGDGTMSVVPSVLTNNSTGNTLVFTYTAGQTTWSSSGGRIEVEIPAGWSLPSLTGIDSGYYTVVLANAPGAVISLVQIDVQKIIVEVKDLPASTGQIIITYGDTGAGGLGASVTGLGIQTFITSTSSSGSAVTQIASSPYVTVIPPTATATATPSVTPTQTQTSTITMTHSITPTHSITQTHSITPTITETSTITQTSTITKSMTITQTHTFSTTPTITHTVTITLTSTPTWEIMGTPAFSTGQADYVKTFVYNGTPYVAYSDRIVGRKVVVKKLVAGAWANVGVEGISAGTAEDIDLHVYNNVVYVAYRDLTDGNKAVVMRYAEPSGPWEEVVISGHGASSGAAYDLSLWVEGSVNVYLAYRDAVNANMLTIIKNNIIVGAAGVWQSVGTNLSAGVVSDIDMQTYNGEPYVAYRDWANAYKTTVGKYTTISGTFDIIGTAGISNGSANEISLHMYNDGTPYVSFREIDNNNRAAVMEFSGTWSYVGSNNFSSDDIDYLSLYVYDGTPYVAYKDPDYSGKVTVARNKTGTWEIVGYGISTGGAEYVSIHFNESLEMPYIAYQDTSDPQNRITVMRYTGAY